MNECRWPGENAVMRRYHDEEWCVPSHNDRYLFEMLSLEGAQAGLSWSTVLAKREEYRRAFHGFDIAACAGLTDEDLERIRGEYGIIKNKQKIRSVRGNARAVLEVQREYGSFADYLWSFAEGAPLLGNWESESQVPAQTELSETISRDLRRRGFQFVGPVIVYSFLQAAGVVDDHIRSCPFHTKNRA